MRFCFPVFLLFEESTVCSELGGSDALSCVRHGLLCLLGCLGICSLVLTGGCQPVRRQCFTERSGAPFGQRALSVSATERVRCCWVLAQLLPGPRSEHDCRRSGFV